MVVLIVRMCRLSSKLDNFRYGVKCSMGVRLGNGMQLERPTEYEKDERETRDGRETALYVSSAKWRQQYDLALGHDITRLPVENVKLPLAASWPLSKITDF